MSYAIRVDGTAEIDLDKIESKQDGGLEKSEGEFRLQQLGEELSELLDLLFFAGQQSLLIVLQGRDTSGKDGAIRRLLGYSNAQSTRVVPFKVPTAEELAHDFLWRVHSNTPGKGEIAVFNRSHYEDVIVVRVHELVPDKEWKRRYEHIRHFEELLIDSDTLLLKFLLHISKEEQEERLLAREEETEKAWKLSAGDWKERELWDEYTRAFNDAVNRCATKSAPWYVIPADRKWFRDVAILETIVDTLRPCRESWLDSLDKLGDQAKAELAEYRSGLRKG